MLINGLISGAFSFLSYYQAIKKNKSDFFNNQLSIIEAEIDYIKDKTYELFIEIFDKNASFDDNLTIRLLNQKNNNLHNKILELDDFKKFSDDVSNYNIFSSNVLEAADKTSAQVQLDSFDELYLDFKSKLCKYQNSKNK